VAISGSTPPGVACANFGASATSPELTVTSSVAAAAGERRAAPSADPAAPADWIVVPPGRAALVEALAGPDSPTGSLALVTDLGMRFPVPSRDVLATLGYAGVTPQRLPAALVALLPSGPALDPVAAAVTS
jgi:hypothetical protein